MQVGPEPATDYSRIEELARKNTRGAAPHSHRIRLAAALAACTVLLIGTVAMAATTEVDYSAWATHSDDFSRVEKIANKLGVALPDTLDDSPFYNITTMYVVPEGTTYLEAISAPVYRWYSVDYGVEDVVRKYDSDEPGSGYSESSVVYDAYSISIGSTDGELCNYVFTLDESGAWVSDNLLPGSYRTEEYNGITLQIGTWLQYDSENEDAVFSYHHQMIWVDANHHAVFSLRKSFYAEEDAADQLPAEMIEFAKEVIDLNAACTAN